MRSGAKEEPRSARLTGAPPARPYAAVRRERLSATCPATAQRRRRSGLPRRRLRRLQRQLAL